VVCFLRFLVWVFVWLNLNFGFTYLFWVLGGGFVPCPWLRREGDKYYCTAVSPEVEVDVKRELCLLPSSPLDPSMPYRRCKRWRPT